MYVYQESFINNQTSQMTIYSTYIKQKRTHPFLGTHEQQYVNTESAQTIVI